MSGIARIRIHKQHHTGPQAGTSTVDEITVNAHRLPAFAQQVGTVQTQIFSGYTYLVTQLEILEPEPVA